MFIRTESMTATKQLKAARTSGVDTYIFQEQSSRVCIFLIQIFLFVSDIYILFIFCTSFNEAFSSQILSFSA
jgi:hypothetical protein